MPNQEFCEPQQDLDFVTNCDLTNSYKSCQPSEKFCRFAYASWCPVCDLNTTRRRSKSECIDSHCRKRGRDKRSQSPNIKNDTPEKLDYLHVREILERGNVRTNLCELPTSYINNCQTHVPSSVDDTIINKRITNFIDPFYSDMNLITKCSSQGSKSPTSEDKAKNGKLIKNRTIASNYFSSPRQKIEVQNTTRSQWTVTNNQKPNGLNKLTERTCDFATAKEQIIQAVKGQQQPDHCTKTSAKGSSPKPNSMPEHICKDGTQAQNMCCTRRHLPTPKSPIKTSLPQSPKDSGDRKTPSNPMMDMKEKIYSKYNFPLHIISPPPLDLTENLENDSSKRKIRERSDSDNSNEIPDETQVDACSVISKKAREISPLESKRDLKLRNAVKVASIKNRHKLSAIKLRKVRSKIAHSISSDSNCSESECSESEDYEDKSENSEMCGVFPGDNIHGSTPVSTYAPPVTQFGDHQKWPIRPSLFAHIPPYIAFLTHDDEPGSVPEGLERSLKWNLSTITPVVVRKTLTNTGFRLVRSEYSRESNDWIGTWGKHIKSVCFQQLKDTQKLNHFPGTFQIGRKDRLWKNLQRLMFKYGTKEFGFIPRTFVLPQDLKSLRQSWEKSGSDKWIIKPPASARGSGIRVIHRWSHLPKKKPLVVQQYISNPYLINGSKFDLRLYVLVTSFNPLRIYLYPDGLARFASTKYSDDLNSLSDRYMHLTNYSINKLSSQYTANEDANACKGHKWTLSKLWEYLEQDGVNTKTIWRNLQQLVIKTMICGESSINQLYKANVNSRYNCYELFGVDVLLDERLKPWLLEVNISPSLHSASPLDLHVKGPLVQMLLNLAQFHLPARASKLPHAPPCYNKNLYSTHLTAKERSKHLIFCEFENREDYLKDILKDLTGDDVRHLCQAEDELTVIGTFERIFPTQHSHVYFQYMETRYYNRLFDAWEHRFEKDRRAGIRLLQMLCETKIHLVTPPSPTRKPPLLKETLREFSLSLGEESSTTSDESIQQTIPPRPQTSPAQANLDPTNKLRADIQCKMMSLKLGPTRSLTPF